MRRGDAADYRVLEADRDAYAAVLARWRSTDEAKPKTVRAGEPGAVHNRFRVNSRQLFAAS